MARTVESDSGHDFIGIAIGIVIEVPLSAHTGSNNPGSYSVSTIHKLLVPPLDFDSDSDSDFEAQHRPVDSTGLSGPCVALREEDIDTKFAFAGGYVKVQPSQTRYRALLQVHRYRNDVGGLRRVGQGWGHDRETLRAN